MICIIGHLLLFISTYSVDVIRHDVMFYRDINQVISIFTQIKLVHKSYAKIVIRLCLAVINHSIVRYWLLSFKINNRKVANMSQAQIRNHKTHSTETPIPVKFLTLSS